MTSFLVMLKRVPWWGYGIVAILIFFAWESISGWSTSRKLYTLALDNLRADQSRVVEVKEENERMYEQEIANLQADKDRLLKEKATVQKQAAASAAKVVVLEGRNSVLQAALQNIVVSNDPDRVIDDLHKRGLLSIKRRVR